MLSRSFACPVYFIEEEPSVMEVYNKLQVKSAMLSVVVWLVVDCSRTTSTR